MTYAKGDILFIHGTGIFDRIIQIGQALRFPKTDSYYNHVAIVITEDGDLVEAIGKGIKRTNISKYASFSAKDAKLIHATLSDEDRGEAVIFAESCIHEGYGWITIISSALCLLLGLRFSFGFNGTDICSGLVAKCLEHGGQILYKDASHMTPADIMAYFIANPGKYSQYSAR